MWPFGREAAARWAEKIVHKAASLEVRSIDTKLINTEKMFQITMDEVKELKRKMMELLLITTDLRDRTVGPSELDPAAYAQWGRTDIPTQITGTG